MKDLKDIRLTMPVKELCWKLRSGANGVVYHERVVRQSVREFEAGTFF